MCVAAPRYQSRRAGAVSRAGLMSWSVKEGASAVIRRERNQQLPLFPGLQGIQGELQVRVTNPQPERVGKQIKRWYAREAEQVFADRLRHWQALPWLERTAAAVANPLHAQSVGQLQSRRHDCV